ncbi:MAG TPA: hypothetical protein VN732_05025 [Solirubrobacterales bacterium]|nr:hypothetical protein [Solirubrobacterales bacterium]
MGGEFSEVAQYYIVREQLTARVQLRGVAENNALDVADPYGYAFALTASTNYMPRNETMHCEFSGSSAENGSKHPGQLSVYTEEGPRSDPTVVGVGAATLPGRLGARGCGGQEPFDPDPKWAEAKWPSYRLSLSCLEFDVTGQQYFAGAREDCVMSPLYDRVAMTAEDRHSMTVEYKLTRVPTDRLKLWILGGPRTAEPGETVGYRVKVKNTSLRFAENLIVCLEAPTRNVSGRECKRLGKLPGGNIKFAHFNVTPGAGGGSVSLRFEARAAKANKVTRTTSLSVGGS